VIPLTVLEGPTQRGYVFAVYCSLFAWKMYDWMHLVEDNTESFWLVLKWLFIDLVFWYGLPELRVPWCELSPPATTAIYMFHAIFDFMLMFNVPIPLAGWLLGLVKVFYNREEGISGNYVKSYNILHNSSLIMGRQIINILPEGSAMLNPEGKPFCLGGGQTVVSIPLHFNATIPVEVELIRRDLDTLEEEVIKLSRRQIREIDSLSKKLSHDESLAAVEYEWPAKTPGVYRLGKVLDEYKLEVQRGGPSTFVVTCPSAKVSAPPSLDRCVGDLSDLSLQVNGVPPLKIKYSRTVNGRDHSFHFQSLQPDDFTSPLMGSQALALAVPENEDVSWARSLPVTVSLNESMHSGGDWEYSIDEVQDAFGNVAHYISPQDDPDLKHKPKHLVQSFFVSERPKVQLRGCDLRNPMKAAKGSSKDLPVVFEMPGPKAPGASYSLTWRFSPIDTLTKSGDHGDVVEYASFKARNAAHQPRISAPGLYTLDSVASGSCQGEVREPSSCLLLNPLEPTLAISSEEIPDICAGNSVGLRVDLDLTGTPPFKVWYNVIKDGSQEREDFVRVDGLRQQIRLEPRNAGHYKYVFTKVKDHVYNTRPLPKSDDLVLEQSVKPAARATIQRPVGNTNACLEEQVEAEIALIGEPPFTLEYELVHEGKRKQFKTAHIEANTFTLQTEPLAVGGEHTLSLKSVRDKTGCPTFLEDSVKISVRRQRPRGGFGLIDNKRKTMVVADAKAKIPVRLTGDGPWTVRYRNLDDEASKPITARLQYENDYVQVDKSGTYEIIDISDKQCQGSVEPGAAQFVVGWYPRPELKLASTDSISEHQGKFIKRDVCEGDIDGFEINLKGKLIISAACYEVSRLTFASGAAPYHLEYDIKHKVLPGTKVTSTQHKVLDAAMGRASIQMDTSKAGQYSYEFRSLSDSLYNNDKKSFSPMILEQRVNARPSATFDKPGHTYKYCMTESDYDDRIPITLSGEPPFSVEIEIKHLSGSSPEIHTIRDIESHRSRLQIPRESLRLGMQHLRIREVRDSLGCQRKTEVGGPSVPVQLFDAPAIYPLETRTDYCVGERIAYTLSGTPPFEVHYTFDGTERIGKSATTNFRRLAESPGVFAITSIRDKASECRAAVDITKRIHQMPSVRISKGRDARVDIHEGGEVAIQFDFEGTPPFEFTYTRSTNARKGSRSHVLETRHDVSHEHSKVIRASQEGTYEVVAIKDRYCAFSTQQGDGKEQKKLTY